VDETPYTDPFWDALEDGRFSIHRCEACGERFFPPGPVCPHCQSTDVEWEEASATGRLFSFTRQHVTAPEFDDGLVTGVVKLEEGPRVLTAIDEPYEALEIGMRVQIEPTEYVQAFDRGRLEDAPFFIATLR
jgi:uncharacterized protein